MSIDWKAKEHHSGEKTLEWYIASFLIVIAISVTAVVLGNILLAGVVIVGFVILLLNYRREAKIVSVSISTRGILVDDILYTFNNLESFYVEEETMRLILKSKKTFATHIIIPISEEIDPENLEEELSEYLEVEEMHETIFERFAEYLGF